MTHLTPHQSRTACWQLLLGLMPVILLCSYLFIFRWPERFYVSSGDCVVLVTCSFLGVMFIAVQHLSLLLRAVGIICHVALSITLFVLWRLFSQPMLNDVL